MRGARNISQYIRYFVDDCATDLNPYVLQGKLNNEFIRGRQNKKLNMSRQTIDDKKADPSVYTERKIFNRLLPIYLTRYGILADNQPIPGIKPTSYTMKQAVDSLECNKFIQQFCADISFAKLYKKAIKHADIYGLVWFKTGIDWTSGNTIAEVATSVGDTKGTIQLKEGRPFVAVVPMYEVFVDSLQIESSKDVNELVHRRAFPIDYIRKRWGFEAKKESLNDTKLATYPRYTDFGIANAGDVEFAYIYEYYKKPDAVYPKGRYVVTCNDKVLWDDVLPYVNAKNERVIPFDCFNMQSVPNYLVGVTVYSQLIPIQETYNSIKNRYLEYVNHIAIGQLYYWEGSLINKNNFSTKPGKLIGLKRNARPPQPVQKDKLSQEFINYLKTLEEDMLVTAGLSQMTAFGSSKSNVRTDGVVDKLSESDENKLSNALDNISDCIVEVFKKIVYLEKQRVKTLLEDLKVAKVDEYALQYKLGEVDAEQLTIINREFLMQSDQVHDKKLQQAHNMGLYNPQNAMPYGAKLEMLNALGANYLTDTLNPQERATHDLCVDENTALIEGTNPPKAEQYHLHDQHIYEHQLFRISPEVRCLAKKDPKKFAAVQEAIQAHIDEHQGFQQQSQDSNVYANAKAVLTGTAPRG